MAQYRQLNEDIVIEIQDTNETDKNKISIILRNTKSENTNINFDLNETRLIKELKKEVYLFSIRSSIQLKSRKENQ